MNEFLFEVRNGKIHFTARYFTRDVNTGDLITEKSYFTTMELKDLESLTKKCLEGISKYYSIIDDNINY